MDSARFGDVELTYQLREGGERVVLVPASAFVSWYDPRSSRSSLRWRRPSESARWHCSTRCPWDQFKSWVPTIVGLLGAPSRVVIASTGLTTIGGILAAIIIGPAVDKTNPFRTLGIVYLGGAAFVAALGWVIGGGSTWALLGTAFRTGTCVTGGQMSVIALATVLYPPGRRSTGVGWALGIGRLGGIAGPLIVGTALGAGFLPRDFFFALAVVLVVASISVLMLERRSRA
ncbi:hypothetical protein ACNJ7E_32675 [Rhodococcus sp. NM-2]|uniref:hypothetical protein n=1 Tax=Rhodococcus TaxID=1827 RepID=UPI002475EF26|nr:hypothetical protein [Rhodococcus opacus]MDH6287023.1 MFS family permease [Rhodococcus opacus]